MFKAQAQRDRVWSQLQIMGGKCFSLKGLRPYGTSPFGLGYLWAPMSVPTQNSSTKKLYNAFATHELVGALATALNKKLPDASGFVCFAILLCSAGSWLESMVLDARVEPGVGLGRGIVATTHHS